MVKNINKKFESIRVEKMENFDASFWEGWKGKEIGKFKITKSEQ